MKIAIGTDHGGIILKQSILDYLKDKGIEYKDFGTFDESSVDYPDFALPVAESVASGACDCGILLCGTGIGISIAANKVKGIRAAVAHDEFTAAVCKEHNNANILALGGRVVKDGETAAKLVDLWLNTQFAGGRHARRVEKISAIEDKYMK